MWSVGGDKHHEVIRLSSKGSGTTRQMLRNIERSEQASVSSQVSNHISHNSNKENDHVQLSV